MPDDPTIELSFYERFLSERGLTWERAPDGGLFYENLGSTFVLVPDEADARRLRMVMPWLRLWDDRQAIPAPLSASVSRRCPGTVLSVRQSWLRAEIASAVERPALLGPVFGRCTTRLVETRGIVRSLLGPVPGDIPWGPARLRPQQDHY